MQVVFFCNACCYKQDVNRRCCFLVSLLGVLCHNTKQELLETKRHGCIDEVKHDSDDGEGDDDDDIRDDVITARATIAFPA